MDITYDIGCYYLNIAVYFDGTFPSCHVLHKPTDQKWIVEEGYKHLDELLSEVETPLMNGASGRSGIVHE